MVKFCQQIVLNPLPERDRLKKTIALIPPSPPDCHMQARVSCDMGTSTGKLIGFLQD